MTINSVLIIQIRAELKRALTLIIDGAPTETEAQKLLQNLKNFNDAARLSAPSATDSPGFHIHVEPTTKRRHRDDDDEPSRNLEETQSIEIDDWKKPHPAKK